MNRKDKILNDIYGKIESYNLFDDSRKFLISRETDDKILFHSSSLTNRHVFFRTDSGYLWYVESIWFDKREDRFHINVFNKRSRQLSPIEVLPYNQLRSQYNGFIDGSVIDSVLEVVDLINSNKEFFRDNFLYGNRIGKVVDPFHKDGVDTYNFHVLKNIRPILRIYGAQMCNGRLNILYKGCFQFTFFGEKRWMSLSNQISSLTVNLSGELIIDFIKEIARIMEYNDTIPKKDIEAYNMSQYAEARKDLMEAFNNSMAELKDGDDE